MKTVIMLAFAFFCLLGNAHGKKKGKPAQMSQFYSLPIGLQDSILNKIGTNTIIKGVFDTIKNYNKLKYLYNVNFSKSKITGYVYIYKGASKSNAVEVFFSGTILYCCKDPHHHPQEMANTKDELLEIQKKHHCSKIGVCIID